MMSEAAVESEDLTWHETRRTLEEEIARLPENLRSALIACFFDGLTQEQAGQALSVSPNTLKWRLARGRELLRKRLLRRGISLTVLGAVLSGGEIEAVVSTGLKEATLRGAAAVLEKASLPGVVSPTVLSVIGTVPRASGWGIVATAILGLGLSTGAVLFVSQRPSAPAAEFTAADSAPALDEPADSGDDSSDAFQKSARETAARYVIHPAGDADRKFVLSGESLLRWTNPVGGHQAHGEVFLWTDRGRPQAVLSLYQVTDTGGVHEHHEFSSLSQKALRAERSGQPAWAPAGLAIELKAFPDAPAPQSSERLRLVQMRRLAEQCRADKTTRENVRRELRLLPKPVYRYESDDPEVLDGALFAFVEGTDPEVFLMLEARAKGKDEFEWQYAAARMNSVRVRVLRGEQMLWEGSTLPWEDVFDRPDKAYTALRIR